jgi:UDP-glucuronate 4-epimerase
LNQHPTSQTVLLTGAAGFIGSHVAERLLARGQPVIGLDNFDSFYSRSHKQSNLNAVAQSVSSAGTLFRFIEGDICDAPMLAGLFAEHRPLSVVHLAAKAGVRPSIEDPAGYVRANVLGTATLFEAARANRCERIVMASSSSVYGNAPSAPFSEEVPPSDPVSPYAATKRACELLAATHFHLTKMPVASLRFFTVYGPRQRPDLAISSFLGKIASGAPIRLFGDGRSSRDYTYIDDIVRGVIAALDRIDSFGSRVWNLGNSHPITLSEMVATLERVVGRPAIIERASMQPGDVDRTWADISRSRAELGYEPATDFETGVRAQWDWMNTPAARPA